MPTGTTNGVATTDVQPDKNDANGTAKFSAANYTQANDNGYSYWYEIRERIPDDTMLQTKGDNNNKAGSVSYGSVADVQKTSGIWVKDGVTYDPTVYYVRVWTGDKTGIVGTSFGAIDEVWTSKGKQQASDANDQDPDVMPFTNRYDVKSAIHAGPTV